MNRLDEVAPAFRDMAHSIVWASVATVDGDGRPRTRILHPIWAWDAIATRRAVWDRFASGPEPVGYDPAIIAMWREGPLSEQFAVLRLSPYRLRVMAGTVMTRGEGLPLVWVAS